VAGRRYRIGRAAGAAGEARVVLADADGPIARFEVAEAVRPEALDAIRRIAARAAVEILSGDAAPRVAAVAEALGVSRWTAEATPEDKLARIRALQAEGRTVAMVGDGINDAAVLGGADVAIALGGGAALALTAADAVILADRLDRVADLVDVAATARRNMRQNLAWALAYNLGGLPLAALGFVPPWAAALGMALSSLLVTTNALRVARWRRRGEPPRARTESAPRARRGAAPGLEARGEVPA
jgi:Cu2+-exporting ATPase